MRFMVVSDKGGRTVNEDAVGHKQKGNTYCFVLADGLGGHGCGDVASKLAVDTILECFDAQPEISKDMAYSYLEAAQNALIDARNSNPQYSNMGTTITLLITDGTTAVWGHCGDSRIYRIKKNKIQEITNDHSVAFASFLANEIRYSDIRTSPDQNKLLRTLSNGSKFIPDISDAIVLPKNSVFLMCSDGFWEYVDEDFIEKSLRKNSSAKDWMNSMIEQRNKLAPSDADNFSAVAVMI